MMLREIDNINLQIADMLVEAKSSLDIFCFISENTAILKKQAWREDFWAFIQKIALDSIVLCICKVFEKESVRGYEQNSIEKILNIIETHSLKPLAKQYILVFLAKYTKTINNSRDEAHMIDTFCKTCRDFKEEKMGALKKIKDARDKKVAHSDVDEKITSIASVEDIEKVIEFGCDFYAAISNAYVGVFPVDIRKNNRKRDSLKRLFKQLESCG